MQKIIDITPQSIILDGEEIKQMKVLKIINYNTQIVEGAEIPASYREDILSYERWQERILQAQDRIAKAQVEIDELEKLREYFEVK